MATTKLLTAAGKVKPPNAGKGRVKGTPNKITKALKDMILGALDDAGGQAYLAKQAEANPAAFMTLVGKVLPLQIEGRVEVADVSNEPLSEGEWKERYQPPVH